MDVLVRNEGVPRPFLVDTGAQVSMVPPSLWSQLVRVGGIRDAEGDISVVKAAGARTQLPIGRMQISVGEIANVRRFPVRVVRGPSDSPDLPAVLGLAGRAFHDKIIDLDFRQNRFRVYDAGGCSRKAALAGDDLYEIPSTEAHVADNGRVHITVSVDTGQRVKCLLDTGCNGSLRVLANTACVEIASAREKAGKPLVPVKVDAWGALGNRPKDVSLCPECEIRVGDLSLGMHTPELEGATTDRSRARSEVSGLLGQAALRGHRVVIDHRRRKVFMS